MRFVELPSSSLEAEAIKEIWSRWSGAKASIETGSPKADGPAPALLMRGAEASEPAFKALAPGRRVLHLATHGFFIHDQCMSALDATRGIGGLAPLDGPPSVTEENPLLLSGLVLAGANRRDRASPDAEDGILTAEEIAALDLSGVEWAVLSACDTGVGEIRAGEGVLGLRRAFRVAGARTTIMSLWPVEDRSALNWMTALYEARFLNDLPTLEATRKASLSVLRQRREAGESDHPFYWAGFVAAGDWR
jgi:CHAT domain-containing protein